MTYSNLSKIKTSFRTKGNITGNFGVPKSKAGSPLNDIGNSNKKCIKVVKPEEYLARLYTAYDQTNDPKLKRFLFEQIRAKLIQTNRWN